MFKRAAEQRVRWQNNIENYKTFATERRRMLIRLNALRVMAEAMVVDHHLGTRKDDVFQILSGEISSDLMSFFFVLSGFVAMYSNAQQELDTIEYMKKLLCKTFPLYFIVTVVGCVNAQVRHWVVTDNQKICGYLDFVLLSPWIPVGTHRTSMVQGGTSVPSTGCGYASPL